MRIATRVVLGLLFVGLLLLGALLIATALVGPGTGPSTKAAAGPSRPAEDNWRTHSGPVEGIPVAILLLGDFARAWWDMASLPPLAISGTVVILGVDAYLLRRFLRRHQDVSLPA